jgi:ribosomal protein L11 methyltransferase
VIDPGQAFGTGSHATTRLCLELLLSLEPNGSLLDLGCGSGVLAIAAARLGYEPVRAIDNDPASIEAAAANAAINGVSVELRRLDLRREPVPYADTVAANLLTPLLETWAAALNAGGSGPRRLIASGILGGEVDGVAAAFEPCGLVEADRRLQGEWGALVLERALAESPG